MAVVDLFCGCGGLSKGFELAGFDIVAAYDGWQAALDCYNANFEHGAQNIDLNDVEHAVEIIAELHPTVIVSGVSNRNNHSLLFSCRSSDGKVCRAGFHTG